MNCNFCKKEPKEFFCSFTLQSYDIYGKKHSDDYYFCNTECCGKYIHQYFIKKIDIGEQFTKDELNLILRGLNNIYNFENPELLSKIKNKIKSLINIHEEKKCDHEFKLCRSYYGIEENKYRCTKCLKTYDEVIHAK